MIISQFTSFNLGENYSEDKLNSSESNLSSPKCRLQEAKREETTSSVGESVSEGFVSPVVVENSCPLDKDVSVVGPSKPKSSRIEARFLESLRASLKEEITSEIKNLLVESQREMLKLLKPETREHVREYAEEETEKETRNFYTPTKSVRINSTQNNDKNASRNTVLAQ